MSFKHIFIALCLLNCSYLVAQTWQQVGLDSVQIEYIHAEGETIYCAGRSVQDYYAGFIFKSTNGGVSWALQSGELPPTKFRDLELRDITAFTIDSRDLRVIYAAVHGLLYKTTNSGESWQLSADTTNQLLESVRHVAISPYNSEIVFAIDRLPAPAGNLDNLFRSTDGGMTWEFVGGDFPVSSHGVVIQIAFDPTDDAKMFAVADNTTTRRFYRSTDAGIRWQALSNCKAFKVSFTQKDGKWNILNYYGGGVSFQ